MGEKVMTEPLESPKWAGSKKEKFEEAAISIFASMICWALSEVLFVVGLGVLPQANNETIPVLLFLGTRGGLLLMGIGGIFLIGSIAVWFIRMRTSPNQEAPPTPSLDIGPLGPTGL